MKDNGDRFPLLLYRRAIARHRLKALALTALFLGLWYLIRQGITDWPPPPADVWALAGSLVTSTYALLTLVAPRFAYVQPRRNHLHLQTPFFRLHVSYRRMLGTRPVDLARAYPPRSMGRADRRLVAPFYAHSAVGIELKELPLPRFILRLFLGRYFLTPDQTGLLLIVDQWMTFSQQVAVRLDALRQARQERPRRPGPDAGRLLETG